MTTDAPSAVVAERRWAGLGPELVVGAVFVVSRVIFAIVGVRFDAVMLDHAWQLVDPKLLDEHLLESVWYLHMQPPLFNLGVGVLLKLSPLDDAVTLQLAWLMIGAALALALLDLGRLLGLSRWAAATAAAAIACTPPVILFENWFQYEYPLMLLVVLLVSSFVRWQRTGRLRLLAATTGLAGAIVLTRSLFHPVWLVAVVALAVLARPRNQQVATDEVPPAPAPVRTRNQQVAAHGGPPAAVPALRSVLAVALVPLVLVGAVMAKNQVLFGRSELSSWFGWNLYRISFAEVNDADRRAMVDAGELPPSAVLWLNMRADAYDKMLGPCVRAHPDVPALAEPTKHGPAELPGFPPDNNLNDECYLPVYDQFRTNAWAMISARPGEYVGNVGSAFQLWALPSEDYVYLRKNRAALGAFDSAYQSAVLLAVPLDPPGSRTTVITHVSCRRLGDEVVCGAPGGRYRASVTIIAGTLLTLMLLVRGLWRWRRRHEPAQAVWVLIGGTVAWVTLTGNLFELQENHRFRAMVEPLVLLVLIVVATRLFRRMTEREPGRESLAPTGAGASDAPDEAAQNRPRPLAAAPWSSFLRRARPLRAPIAES